MLLFLGRVSCSVFWTWRAIIQLRGMVYSASVALNRADRGRKALVRTGFNPKPIGGGWGSAK